MMIASVVALASFFAENFPNIFWYPYWYLGNPYHYLIGPLVPLILAIFKPIFPIVQLYPALIFLSFMVGGAGVWFLVRDFQASKKQAWISAFLFFFLPGAIFLLRFQSGLYHLAFCFLPFILLLYKKFLEQGRLTQAIFLSISIAFVALIDISIMLPLIVGFVTLLLSWRSKGDWGDWIDKSIKASLIIILGLALATVWYTPNFWWVMFTNPSLGGISFLNLATSFLKFMFNLLPLVFAFWIVKLTHFKPKGLELFSLLFLGSFLLLTGLRFLLDPDFVMDWISFLLELQLGLSLFLARFLGKIGNIKIVGVIGVGVIFIWIWLIRGLWEQDNYQKNIVSLLKDNVKSEERIFLSGSSVFWINSFLPLAQIRGGRDEGSYHPFWDKAAYQIREGGLALLTQYWLQALGTRYVLVHSETSNEPFRDFKNQDKFQGFKLIKQSQGDLLFEIEGANIARVADLRISKSAKPKSGADLTALSSYIGFLKRPAKIFFQEPSRIKVEEEFKEGEVLSLAISFHPGWKLLHGEGNLSKDSLGNLVIVPKRYGFNQFEIVFRENLWGRVFSLVFSALILLALSNYHMIFYQLKKRLKLILGVLEEE